MSSPTTAPPPPATGLTGLPTFDKNGLPYTGGKGLSPQEMQDFDAAAKKATEPTPAVSKKAAATPAKQKKVVDHTAAIRAFVDGLPEFLRKQFQDFQWELLHERSGLDVNTKWQLVLNMALEHAADRTDQAAVRRSAPLNLRIGHKEDELQQFREEKKMLKEKMGLLNKKYKKSKDELDELNKELDQLPVPMLKDAVNALASSVGKSVKSPTPLVKVLMGSSQGGVPPPPRFDPTPSTPQDVVSSPGKAPKSPAAQPAPTPSSNAAGSLKRKTYRVVDSDDEGSDREGPDGDGRVAKHARLENTFSMMGSQPTDAEKKRFIDEQAGNGSDDEATQPPSASYSEHAQGWGSQDYNYDQDYECDVCNYADGSCVCAE